MTSELESVCPTFVGACLEAQVVNSPTSEALWQETRAGPSLYSIARDIFELVPSCLKDDSQVWVLFNCSLEYYLLGGGSERAVLSSGCPVVPPHAATD